jgi:hyperosmotically inducible protein
MWRQFILAATVVTSLAAPAIARAEVTDAELSERVVDAIQRYAQFSIFDDVDIAVSDRVVRLTGRVTMPFKRDEIGKRVARIDGIRSLVNDIQVLPVSPVDSELRVRVAQAIYNHTAFWQFAQMVSPPIHIVVENGHITLTGRVNTEVERSLAGTLAHVPGAFDVKNQLRIDR